MIWQVAAFSGVEVLTYCVMSVTIFMCLFVCRRRSISQTRELLRRYKFSTPAHPVSNSFRCFDGAELAAGGKAAEAIRQRLLVRMGDISQYMKALKQRFSVWYNRSHQRTGTLWNERFKSVLVEGRGNPLQTMAAYIDLNPVRAGLVKDPKDYRFRWLRGSGG